MKDWKSKETTPYRTIDGDMLRQLLLKKDGSMARASRLYGRSDGYIAQSCNENRMSEELINWLSIYLGVPSEKFYTAPASVIKPVEPEEKPEEKPELVKVDLSYIHSKLNEYSAGQDCLLDKIDKLNKNLEDMGRLIANIAEVLK